MKRLKTDYIDVYHMHGFDALTPIEETLSTLDKAVRQGKLRYIAASNFSGWHLQKVAGGQRASMGGRGMSATRSIIRWWAATTSGS